MAAVTALRLALVGLSVQFAACTSASDSVAHFHPGKLKQYEIGPPSILLSVEEEQKLEAGEDIMQAILQDDGVARRLVMVKDVQAPPEIILDRIMDIDAYPRMIKGCDGTKTYESQTEPSGRQLIKTKYEIHALHLHFTYFMVHEYDPAERCMVFHLDYDRRSDLDDSVGYWFVQPKGPAECRVYYSCVTKLRNWVPGPVYALMTKAALKQTTTWVDYESLKVWELEKARRSKLNLADKLRAQMAKKIQMPLLQMPKLPTLPSVPPLPMKTPRWLTRQSEIAVES